MSQQLILDLASAVTELHDAGLYKPERVISSPQDASVRVNHDQQVLNFCANNYLGLANHPDIVQAAKEAVQNDGFGMSSVRFICGTQSVHKELEQRLSRFLGTEDTILYPSCFDANGGLFEALLGPEDAIISDALNHASIIDGVRLCKAQRFRYRNNDMNDLESQLKAAQSARHRLIVTDGVFSMDGTIADLKSICALAKQYNALVMFDDCHATGFIGANGRGTHELHDVVDQVDIITGTLGKTLGGGMGGYTAAKKPIIDWLRQRSRPYLFSNSLAPMLAAAAIKALDLIEQQPELRIRLHDNAKQFRQGMTAAGFELIPGEHPIIPVMLGDAKLAGEMAAKLLQHGVYVIGFSYPVVPKGQARIRTQMSAAHSPEQIAQAITAFTQVGRELGVIA
jgi:glycine C-acetyltransferase